jgi:uncharacterized protein (DUF1015 family)
MSTLVPFRALRPTPDAASRVASVPYDVVNTEEARALADGNRLSFLHVSRAEIDLPDGTDPYSDAVYAKAVTNFEELRRSAPLLVEDAPSLYVYRLRMGAHTQTGVAGCFALAEYEAGTIKKHERTRPDKEDDRTRHILEIGAQTGPVFLTYLATDAVDAIVRRATAAPPLFDFAAADGVQHSIWRVAAGEQRSLIEAFSTVPALYIADGHHRAASAARARQRLGAGGQRGEWDTFLAVAFPHDQMQVLPYNRVVKDLASHTQDSFLRALRDRLSVTEGPASPTRKGLVAMFLGDRWWNIELGPPAAHGDPAAALDVSRLQDLVLAPLLGVGDVRTDTRIDFVGGLRGTAELERLVSTRDAAVAFSMYPVQLTDLVAISDGGGIMPPKSTWFEPKLRDGLLSHLI